MEERLNELESNPADWALRCAIARGYFEAGSREEAARLLLQAPEFPAGDREVVFAAMVIGSTDPASAIAILDQYAAVHGIGVSVLKAKKQLSLALKAATPATPYTPPAGPVPVPTEPPEDATESSEPASKAAEPKTEESQSPETVKDQPERAADEETKIEKSVPGPTLIVVEGEAVHAAEKEPDTREKRIALIAAVSVHIVLILLLTFWTVSQAPPPPPQIIASAVPSDRDETRENLTMKRTKTRTASAVSTVKPVVTSEAFSDLALPDSLTSISDLNIVAIADGDIGFGMSMGGFGDVSNQDAIPAGMRARCSMNERMRLLRESGGQDRAEAAVVRGLNFLTSRQNPKTGAIGDEFTAAMTGLTLLAYLGHCETPESSKYGDAVVSAALFLMDIARKNDGRITNGKRGNHETYEHAIATYALAELYTMSRASGREIPQLEGVLRKAVEVTLRAQSRNGGWSYGFDPVDKGEDMSVSSWHIQALKAVHLTGRNFAGVTAALDLATLRYLPSIQDKRGAFKYRPGDAQGKASLTGAALLSMQIWKGENSPEYKKGLSFLTETFNNPIPRLDDDFYTPYYNTQAFFHVGGKEWEHYNNQFQPWLLDHQNPDGSWTMPGSSPDRLIYNTAWAILMLEVYYRYLPTTEKVSGSRR